MAKRSFVREAIDPNGTLPEVEFIFDPNISEVDGPIQAERIFIVSDGKNVGWANLVRDLRSKEARFAGIEVKKRGRGFGLAAYILAVEQSHERGETFCNDREVLSPSAARIWQLFIEAGVAEVVEPLKLVEYDFGDAYVANYTGHIRVSPSLHT